MMMIKMIKYINSRQMCCCLWDSSCLSPNYVLTKHLVWIVFQSHSWGIEPPSSVVSLTIISVSQYVINQGKFPKWNENVWKYYIHSFRRIQVIDLCSFMVFCVCGSSTVLWPEERGFPRVSNLYHIRQKKYFNDISVFILIILVGVCWTEVYSNDPTDTLL